MNGFFRARAVALSLGLSLALLGCARSGAPLAASPGMDAAAGSNPHGQEGAPGAVQAPGASSASTAPPGSTRAVATNAPLPGGEEPTPDKALPELRVEPLGMHVGGGTNSPEEKAPFHRALERQFPAFMDCYKLVDEPSTGGSFGIDIKIARAGGAPQVEQPRTKLKGAGFQDCMVSAFTKAQFEKPKAGPTVISYSIMFTLGKPKK